MGKRRQDNPQRLSKRRIASLLSRTTAKRATSEHLDTLDAQILDQIEQLSGAQTPESVAPGGGGRWTQLVWLTTVAVLAIVGVVFLSPFFRTGDDLRTASTITAMPEPRAEHRMVLLDGGSVLVASGRDSQLPDASTLRSTFVYDVDANTWSEKGQLIVGRSGFGDIAPLPGSSALVAGGTGGENEDVLRSSERYDPSRRAWVLSGDLNVARTDAAILRLYDGRIMITGGRDKDQELLASTELYDPNTHEWTLLDDTMPQARANLKLVLLADRRILAIGGSSASSPAEAQVLVFDPRGLTWSSSGYLIDGRADMAVLSLPDGRVMIAGGHNGKTGSGILAFSSAELYDPSTGSSVHTSSKMHALRQNFSLHLLHDGNVLALGGGDDPEQTTPGEIYNPKTGMWNVTHGAYHVPPGSASISLGDGRVFVTGGWDPSGQPSAAASILRR